MRDANGVIHCNQRRIPSPSRPIDDFGFPARDLGSDGGEGLVRSSSSGEILVVGLERMKE